MFVESSRANPDLTGTWLQYSTKAHVVGALLLAIDPAQSHSAKIMDTVVANMLLIASLVAPMLLARGLPWFTTAAVGAGVVKAHADQRLTYVLGSGLQCGGLDFMYGDDEDEDADDAASDASGESTESLVDFLVSVTQMTPEELAALPSEAVEVALTALRMITPAVTAGAVGVVSQQAPVAEQQAGCSNKSTRSTCRDPDGMCRGCVDGRRHRGGGGVHGCTNTCTLLTDDHSSSDDDNSESGQSMYIQSEASTSAALDGVNEATCTRPARQEATEMCGTWLDTQQAASQAAAAATLTDECAAPPPVVDGDRMPQVLQDAGGTLREAGNAESGAGTAWVEDEDGLSAEKRGSSSVRDQLLQHPGSMLFVEGDTERRFMAQRFVWNREVWVWEVGGMRGLTLYGKAGICVWS